MEPNKPSISPPQSPQIPVRPGMDVVSRQRPLSPSPVAAPLQPSTAAPVNPVQATPPPSQPIDSPVVDEKKPKKRRKWVIILIIFIVLSALVAGAVVGGNMWYQNGLQAVTTDKNAARIRVTIESGSTPEIIGNLLKERGLIRDATVFMLYTKERGVQGKLQAGSFNLKPSDDLAAIVDHLVAGKTDEFNITFLPGANLMDHRKVLINAGYGEAEIDAAFKKTYSHAVFASKPAEADLEGYIFGETYQFTADASVEDILVRTFDELEKQIKQYDLVAQYKKQGLSLYQGITLASIVQREVADVADSKQVAQVFFKRLNEGYPLGADATFVYAARKVGATPSVDFDSPYNTRKYQGLPPGPIASPGSTALQAVAGPASGDFLYFVSGDDGKTHFSKTLAEHEALTAQYCHKNCALF